MRLGNNSVVVLDIGNHECKIAQYSVGPSSIRLMHRDVFEPIDAYIHNGRLTYIDEFVSDLLKFFGKSGITAKRVMICSTVFGIVSSLESWEAEDLKALNGLYQSNFANSLTNLQIGSWQFYEMDVTENTIKSRVSTMSCKADIVQAVHRAFMERGLRVTHLIDTTTAMVNLLKLSTDDFERPARFFLDLGDIIRGAAIAKNVPIELFTISSSFGKLIDGMSKKLGVSTEIAKYLLFTVGFVDSPVSTARLEHVAVDKHEYYSGLIEFGKQVAAELKATINFKSEQYKVTPYRVLLVGGYAGIPGISDALREYLNCDFLEYTELFEEGFEFNGKQISSAETQDLDARYLMTLGTLLGSEYRIQGNLMKLDKLVIDLRQSAKIIPKLALLASIVYLGLGLFKLVPTELGLIKDREKAAQVSTLQNKILELETGIALMDSNLNVLDTVDTVVSESLEFFSRYDNSKLLVATMDSESMLLNPIVTNSAIAGSVLPDPAASQSLNQTVTADTPSVANQSAGGETSAEGEVVSNESVAAQAGLLQKQKYILRGYSRDHETIISFFEEYKAQEFISEAVLNGIDRIDLPSGEELYLFEIVLKG